MTFITGPSLATKSAPVVNDKPQEQVIQMRVVRPPPPPSVRMYRFPPRVMGPPLFICAAISLVVLACLLLLLTMMPYPVTTTRYQGFCTIPLKELPEEPSTEQPSYKVMPLRWTSDPDEQVFSATNDHYSDEVINGLREKFDIGGSVEKISVEDNGRHVNFIHDFEANLTGIVDSERCFLMTLDPEVVMAPEVLVLSIEGGAQWDVSRVRAQLRAALPALRAANAALRDHCLHKPVYQLHKDDQPIIRKREVDGPAHDYIHFAGHRVQEIEISNLAELLQLEQDNKVA